MSERCIEAVDSTVTAVAVMELVELEVRESIAEDLTGMNVDR